MLPHPGFSIEMGSYRLFCLGWMETFILPISDSFITRMISSCNNAQLLVEMVGLPGNKDYRCEPQYPSYFYDLDTLIYM
jgi:hypothetical protein